MAKIPGWWSLRMPAPLWLCVLLMADSLLGLEDGNNDSVSAGLQLTVLGRKVATLLSFVMVGESLLCLTFSTASGKHKAYSRCTGRKTEVVAGGGR
jgi:hypothetical protein